MPTLNLPAGKQAYSSGVMFSLGRPTAAISLIILIFARALPCIENIEYFNFVWRGTIIKFIVFSNDNGADRRIFQGSNPDKRKGT